MPPNENKMSDGYRERAPVEVGVFLSLEIVIAQRVAVRSMPVRPYAAAARKSCSLEFRVMAP